MYNEFREFKTIKEAKTFGEKYYGDWLKEFQKGKKYRGIYDASDLDYLCFDAEEDYLKQIKLECEVYKVFSYYCGNYGKIINEYCRIGNGSIESEPETIEAMISLIKFEIEKFVIKENIVAFRTLSYRDLLIVQRKTKLKKGMIIVDEGFMGVGLVREELLKEQKYDTVIKVLIPKGCHGIYLDLISNRENEQEILLNKGTKLKIISNKKWIFSKTREIVCKVVIE
ncbi:ADP-ribosyltransferase [Clostridium diolis]|uniref:ADP-ribosyltransferase n=1 Tax=Clostridium diolis TaxID=223919 RepID=UPI0015C63AB5|nr:ADP-ribosyltransferase [Clostridium diolis]